MLFELHQSGGLDCLGQMWTWVGVESSVDTGLIGLWSNVQRITGNNQRQELIGDRQRVALTGNRERVET